MIYRTLIVNANLAAVVFGLIAVALLMLGTRAALRSTSVLSVGARYMRSRGITYVAMALMASVIVIYLLVISVLEGINEHYMDKLQSVLAHITVNVGNIAGGIEHPEEWAAEIAKVDPGIKGVTIGLESPAMALFDNARTVGTLRGVDLDNELKIGRLKEILFPTDIREFGVHEQGGKKLPGCIVGGAWRKNYGLRVGGRVTFVFTGEDDDNPRAVAFAIIGFFAGQNPYLENGAYVDRRFLATKLEVPGRAKTLAVWLNDPNREDLGEVNDKVRMRLAALIRRDVPEPENYVRAISAETWQQKENSFYTAISNDNKMMRVIMGIFLALIAFIVYLIFGRMVAEKVRDIGALRAMGATPESIRGCFLMQAFFMSCAGLLLGLLGAGAIVGNINAIANFVGYNPYAGEFARIPAHTLPFDVILISILTVASALIGAFFPALRASRLNPVECLRHE